MLSKLQTNKQHDIFGVPLRPHNRWGGFKAPYETWRLHLETTRRRAILLVDEAQDMSPVALSVLRLVASAQFDSQPLLCVVLAGDSRLVEKLRLEELIPLGSTIRTRLATEHNSREELQACLKHLMTGAGNASLITPKLQHTLCDHAAGNSLDLRFSRWRHDVPLTLEFPPPSSSRAF